MQAPLENAQFVPIGHTTWTPKIIYVFDWTSANKILQLWRKCVNSDQACRNCVWKFFYRNNRPKSMVLICLFGVWGVTPLSTVFQLCRGSLFYWWEEIGVHGENHRPIAGNWQTLSHNVVSRTSRHEGGSNLKL